MPGGLSAAATGSDEATTAMLMELRHKEAVGYPQKTFENMHRRLAEEVCVYIYVCAVDMVV